MSRRAAIIIDVLEPIVRKMHRLERLTHRQIARRLAISRGTVATILQRRRLNRTQREKLRRIHDLDPLPTGWCTQCHAPGTLPCTACAARKWRKKANLPP